MSNSMSESVSVSNISVRDITQVALFAALTAVLAFVTVPLPFSPVPVTGQTLGVMLAGLFLGSRKAALSQIIYAFLGGIGLPIFAGGGSGFGSFVGPTGGYIWGFIAGAYIIGKLVEIKEEPDLIWKTTSLVIGGIIVIYTFGVAQMMIVTEMNIAKAFTAGALPFLPGDIFKVVLTLLIGQRGLKQLINRE
ncbi:MAG: biotin transporter BioY [Halothermotrichaceae bacterium]